LLLDIAKTCDIKLEKNKIFKMRPSDKIKKVFVGYARAKNYKHSLLTTTSHLQLFTASAFYVSNL
jgi:hypothetical protein